LAIAAGIAVSLGSGLSGDVLLCLAPVLALAVTLLARRYPGERLLIALAAGERKRRPRAFESAHRPRSRGFARVPRGGLLIGFALAVRPPPPASLAR
jgi:hypothetical protein